MDSSELHRLLLAAREYAAQELTGVDSSHDLAHCERVAANAVSLAKQEGLPEEKCKLLQLCGLLHDVKDWKYSGSTTANKDAVQAFLAHQGASPALIAQVVDIISTVGFKDELGAAGSSLPLENAILQDADRLDAIGAVGIARCFTFGGAFKRTLYDPAVLPRQNLTKEQYTSSAAQATTINHFYEKLLRLKDMMKTRAGRQTAEGRHAFMEQYLQQFLAEWEGRA